MALLLKEYTSHQLYQHCIRASERRKYLQTDGESTAFIVKRPRLGKLPRLIRKKNIDAIYFGGNLISLRLIQSHSQPGTASTRSSDINTYIFPRIFLERLNQLDFSEISYLHRYHLPAFILVFFQRTQRNSLF